jgi:arginine deiminase
VALKEGVVVGYDRNEKTILEFERMGIQSIHVCDLLEKFENGLNPKDVNDTLILLSSYELSRARGGSHCMTMPLLRKDL